MRPDELSAGCQRTEPAAVETRIRSVDHNPPQPGPSHPARFAPVWLVVTAFAAVYVIWGSTYLGIRLAIDSMPPLLMAGSRFLIAGLLLYGIMRLRGAERPRFEHWRNATIIGA